MPTNRAQLSATITISGAKAPYTVSVPTVYNVRTAKGVVQPATITYTLDESSQKAGFSLGRVVVKTPSTDIYPVSESATQYVFNDDDSNASESYSFGFYYNYADVSYYFDPVIVNEDPD
jgi:hypothetical protein